MSRASHPQQAVNDVPPAGSQPDLEYPYLLYLVGK
jgi:hypothetical protein